MAKNQLLCRLMLVFFVMLIPITTKAHSINDVLDYGLLPSTQEVQPSGEQLNWAKSMRHQGQELTTNAIMQKLHELDTYNQGKELDMGKTTSPGAMLKIFVSSSMPKSLLKAYHQQAVKFGGSLVFKGLPSGSFKELTKLVLSISSKGEVGSMQIDDESFERFSISSVPAILLIKEEDCFGEQSCKITYDKVVGSIGVKAALEQFASQGDLSGEARQLLENK